MRDIDNFSILTFASCEILDEAGHKILVASLWKKQTVIFIFLRHFGCVSCRAHAVQVWNDREKYQKNGAKIVFIGNGTPQYITYFKQDLNILDAPIYTDPKLETFHAVGFKRGFLVSLGLKPIINGLKLFRQGHSQGAYTKHSGDLWQLGGVIAIKPNGAVCFHYISKMMGDFAPEKDVSDSTK